MRKLLAIFILTSCVSLVDAACGQGYNYQGQYQQYQGQYQQGQNPQLPPPNQPQQQYRGVNPSYQGQPPQYGTNAPYQGQSQQYGPTSSYQGLPSDQYRTNTPYQGNPDQYQGSQQYYSDDPTKPAFGARPFYQGGTTNDGYLRY